MAPKRGHEDESNFALRPAWRLSDPAIARDAELFWRREQILPNAVDVGERLRGLCVAGYDGDELIALSTARIRQIDFLAAKLAMLRIATASARRGARLASTISAKSLELLEEWSVANPTESVMGMATVTQTHNYDNVGPVLAVWNRLCFIGWTADGEAMHVAWFAHGRVPMRRPDSASAPLQGFVP